MSQAMQHTNLSPHRLRKLGEVLRRRPGLIRLRRRVAVWLLVSSQMRRAVMRRHRRSRRGLRVMRVAHATHD
jgi:hypothetical protein